MPMHDGGEDEPQSETYWPTNRQTATGMVCSAVPPR